MPNLAALYTRVSTDEQVENGYSLDFQKRRLQEYCLQKNIAIYNIYIDEGISGKSITERTALNQLLQDATEHKFDSVLICKTDRLSRNLLDLLTIKMKFDNVGVELVITDEAVNPNDDTGMAMFSMMGVFAELERKRIADRMMSGKKELAMQGIKRRNGNAIAFGYKYVEATDTFEPNEHANIINFIYSSYAEYKSANSIAIYLNNNYPNTIRFNSTTINRIISNPIYKGYVTLSYCNQMAHRKRKLANDPIINKAKNVIPIVSEELWNKCNVIAATNYKAQVKKVTAPDFYLKDVLYCGSCGYSMGTRHSKYKDKKYTFYACPVKFGRIKGQYVNNCNTSGYVSADKIHAQFSAFIKNMKPSSIISKKSISADFEKLKSTLDNTSSMIDKKQQQKTVLLEKLSLGLITDTDYIFMSNKIADEINEIKKIYDESKLQFEKMNDIVEYQNAISNRLKELKMIIKEWDTLDVYKKKTIVNHYISRIEITNKVISKIELK